MRSFDLVIDGAMLGKLSVEKADQPWLICRFEPERSFEKYRALFEAEAQLHEEFDSAIRRGDAADSSLVHAAMDLIGSFKFRLLEHESGEEQQFFFLHIHSDKAWISPVYSQ